jgi:flagellar export protein FliJ
MPFRFPLETILHLRRSVEHQQELRLRAANQQVARMRHVIQQIEQQIASTRTRESSQLNSGTTAAELQFTEACETVLEQQGVAATRELMRVEHVRDQQNKIFQQARRERETFERLRDHQHAEYERNARRREQQQLDELFLLRQKPRRRG